MESPLQSVAIAPLLPTEEKENISVHQPTFTPTPTIRHIVISGGGTFLLNAYGALKFAYQHGFWNYENLQSIDGTSAGSIVGILLCLKMDWALIDSYMIHRPWQNIIKIDVMNIMNAYAKCGILDQSIFAEMFGPLLRYVDLNVNSTMMDLYRHSGIELHMYSTRIGTSVEESMILEDISYKTHPDWKIIDACYASSCLPILFKPFTVDGNTFLDGSVISSYPLKPCYDRVERKEEIFGIKKKSNAMDINLKDVVLTEYLYKLIHIFIQRFTSHSLQKGESSYTIPYQLSILADAISIHDIYDAAVNMEKRKQMIAFGEEQCRIYMGISVSLNNRITGATEEEDIMVEVELDEEKEKETEKEKEKEDSSLWTDIVIV